MVRVRRDVISGLIVVAPVAISLIAILFVLRFISGVPLVAQIEPWYVRAPLVIAVFLTLVMGTGYLMRTTMGALVAETIIGVVNHIPILRMVFNGTRLAMETAVGDRERRTRPVKVEAWDGLRVTAFDTGNRAPDGRLLCFFPTAPNITTGYVIEVEESQVEPTGERIEEALTRLLSAGFGGGDDDRSPAPDGRIVEYVNDVELPGSTR